MTDDRIKAYKSPDNRSIKHYLRDVGRCGPIIVAGVNPKTPSMHFTRFGSFEPGRFMSIILSVEHAPTSSQPSISLPSFCLAQRRCIIQSRDAMFTVEAAGCPEDTPSPGTFAGPWASRPGPVSGGTISALASSASSAWRRGRPLRKISSVQQVRWRERNKGALKVFRGEEDVPKCSDVCIPRPTWLVCWRGGLHTACQCAGCACPTLQLVGGHQGAATGRQLSITWSFGWLVRLAGLSVLFLPRTEGQHRPHGDFD